MSQDHNDELKSKITISGGAAVRIAQAGCAFAASRLWNISICVVDDGGHVLALHRMDAAAPGTADAAVEKARSAALFRAPTKLFEDFITAGQIQMLSLPGTLPIQGGVIIDHGDQVIGAVGVSGVQAHEDEEIATQAITILSGP